MQFENIVLVFACLTFAIFSVTLDRFLSIENILTIARSVSILGILGVGMAIVILARGLDLSMVAIMVTGAGWLLELTRDGTALPWAFLMALGLVLFIGFANGILVAFVEIPSVLATLATGIVIVGGAHSWLVHGSVTLFPAVLSDYQVIGQGSLLGIPIPILIFAAISIIGHIFVSHTRFGLFTRAQGDNEQCARIIGISVRSLIVQQFVVAALIAFVAGIVMACSAGGINMRIAVGTMVFDVILVAVLGGFSLSGGQGRIWGVVISALFIGTLLNGMTILNIDTIWQNIIKTIVLLAAILTDNVLHPQDPETARQGDM
jgi:ribose transport system permease protein